jgi:hypothetical protein
MISEEISEDEDSPEYKRARMATYACLQLVLINIHLVRTGLPGKLYIDMKDAKEYIEYNKFVFDLHCNEIIDLLHLPKYMVLPVNK